MIPRDSVRKVSACTDRILRCRLTDETEKKRDRKMKEPCEYSEICGIILAGGKSTRMGTDKADLVLNGKTFLEIQAEKLRHIGISDICLSGYSAPLPYTRCVADIRPGLGPLGGICSCFISCSCRYALVLSVDTPLISEDSLKDLLCKHLNAECDATILTCDGKMEPLIAVYNTDTVSILKELLAESKNSAPPFDPALRQCHKKLSVRAFLRRLNCQFHEFQGDKKELLNCNTYGDYLSL